MPPHRDDYNNGKVPVTIARSHDKRNVVDYNAEGHKPRVGGEETIAEIIYWDRPQGGRVFHTGSIATA